MSDEFSEYEKMPRSLSKLGLSEKAYAKIERLDWAVTEKVHGANFSFVYQKNNLRFTKRREYLSWKDDFFGFQSVVNRIESKIVALFEHLSTNTDAKQYILYGELFGGKYPHPEVKENKDLQAIQTGVYYSPEIEFYAFDIAVVTHKAEKKYLDFKSALDYFHRNNLVYAKPLYVGNITSAMDFNIDINSKVPSQLNLPELTNNLIEGVVVKPFNDRMDTAITPRPVFKIKNPLFDEDDKYHKAKKWSYIPQVSSNAEDLTYIVDELSKYVTANRLNSAISKIGAFDQNNHERVEKIKSEFLEDTLTDFNEDNSNFLLELSASQKEWLRDRLKIVIQDVITKTLIASAEPRKE